MLYVLIGSVIVAQVLGLSGIWLILRDLKRGLESNRATMSAVALVIKDLKQAKAAPQPECGIDKAVAELKEWLGERLDADVAGRVGAPPPAAPPQRHVHLEL